MRKILKMRIFIGGSGKNDDVICFRMIGRLGGEEDRSIRGGARFPTILSKSLLSPHCFVSRIWSTTTHTKKKTKDLHGHHGSLENGVVVVDSLCLLAANTTIGSPSRGWRSSSDCKQVSRRLSLVVFGGNGSIIVMEEKAPNEECQVARTSKKTIIVVA